LNNVWLTSPTSDFNNIHSAVVEIPNAYRDGHSAGKQMHQKGRKF